MTQAAAQIRVNGENELLAAPTLAALLAEKAVDVAQRGIAVAVNGAVVPRAAWADTMLKPGDNVEIVRARQGDFDGIVAMYHDQGHIALKLMTGPPAVNICAGLPLVRTSVAHGTAYDIAGKGVADHRSLVEAVRVAARLVGKR